MSLTLRWEPMNTERSFLHDETKLALRGRFGPVVDTLITDEDVDFLLGVIAGTANAGVRDDCQTLIANIEEHGSLKLWED